MNREQWLLTPGFRRTVLIEVDCNIEGQPHTFYLANRDYCTAPSETPSNQAYDDWIVSISEFTTELSDAMYGQTTLHDFSVTCRYTEWLYSHVMQADFSNSSVRVFVGDHTWPRADFVLYATGKGQGFSPKSSSEIVLSVGDRQRDFVAPITLQTNDDDVALPKLFGPCFNVSPVQIDTVNRTYCINDGPANVTTVRENGALIPFTDHGDGTFTLTNNAKGKITCDASSSFANAAAVIEALYPNSDIDMPPLEVGLYIDKDISGIDVLDQLCVSTGCFWRPMPQGVFVRSALVDETAKEVFSADMIEPDSLTPSQWLEPASHVSVGFQRNYSPLSEGEIAGVVIEQSPALIAKLTSEYSRVKSILAGGRIIDIDTLLVHEVDAIALRDARAQQVSKRQAIYSFDTLAVPFGVSPGDSIKVESPLFFQSRVGLLIAKHSNLTSDRSTLEVLL